MPARKSHCKAGAWRAHQRERKKCLWLTSILTNSAYRLVDESLRWLNWEEISNRLALQVGSKYVHPDWMAARRFLNIVLFTQFLSKYLYCYMSNAEAITHICWTAHSPNVYVLEFEWFPSWQSRTWLIGGMEQVTSPWHVHEGNMGGFMHQILVFILRLIFVKSI